MFLRGYRSLTNEEINERMGEFHKLAMDVKEDERETYLAAMREHVAKELVEVIPVTEPRKL